MDQFGSRLADRTLLKFKSHAGGNKVDVTILPSRVEWLTAGYDHVTAVIPVTAIESVSTTTGGRRGWGVVIATHNTIVDFRVSRHVAEHATALLSQLIDQQPSRFDRDQRPSAPAQGSVGDELTNLKWMFENGILTEIDFDELRARLPGQVSST